MDQLQDIKKLAFSDFQLSTVYFIQLSTVGSCFWSDFVSKGVDSSHDSTDALEAAKELAQATGAIVAVSGAVDIVTDGNRVVGAHNGVAMLQKITATGCSVTALIAAFVAVDQSHALEATAAALSVFGVASEIGMSMANGPASLRMHLIDSLHGLNENAVISRVKITSFCEEKWDSLHFGYVTFLIKLFLDFAVLLFYDEQVK